MHSIECKRLARIAAAAARSLAAGLALASVSSAQNQLATSPQYAAMLRVAPAGELTTQSLGGDLVTLRAHWESLAQEGTSPNFRMRVSDLGPVQWSTHGPPLVTYVELDRGPQAGGTVNTLHGLRLVDSSGMPAVDVGGALASVQAAGSTEIDFTTSAGSNAYGNPLGPSDVRVTTAHGSGARTEAFTYQPAVRNLSSASIGAVLQLEYTGEPNSLYQLWAGGLFPGVALPIAPFDGAIEVWNPAFDLTPLLFSPTGDAPVPVFVPSDPTLVGATLHVQAISITALSPSLVGSFTNALPVTFAP